MHSFRKRLLENPIGDITGGIMAAVVALPLCLAFGVASGAGAAAGLYGAIACGVLAATFGGTPGQCSGPTGPMTIIAAGVIAASVHPQTVFASTVGAGIIQIVMGKLKAGQLIGYMPYPVISGFMSGIGLIIICVQLAPFFGLAGSGNVLLSLQSLIELPSKWNSHATLLGLVTLLMVYTLPLISKRLPASLIALLAATFLSHLWPMEVPRIGEIPSSFPLPNLPHVHITEIHIVVQSALTLALLGAIDSLLTSLVMDKVTGNRHNSDQELIGQGIGNIGAGLIGGLPGAGATMRSMVNVKSGGTTKLSGMLHGLFLLAILIFFGNAASQIPLSSLAAILITVGISIMDWRVLRSLRTTPKRDAFVMFVVLALTIFVDLIVAVLVGVALASVLFVKQFADARVSSVSGLDTLEELREVTEHIPEEVRKATYSYVLNGPLFFGEAKNLTEAIDHLSDAKYVILRFVNVPLIDQTGAFSLETAIERWQARGIKVLFAGMPEHVQKVLIDCGAKIDMENSFDRFESAIEAIDYLERRGTITKSPGEANNIQT
ncbi:MAG TPA: SulP family inorganic anion transporter [Candidatus Obscuribacterales bacterium]